MFSCLVLEQPGRWRSIGVTTLLVLALLPAAPLLWNSVVSMTVAPAVMGAPFGSALQSSALLALLVAGVSFMVGLPTGVLTALYEFPGRRIFLALLTLPLLMPSFLLAIGWSALATRLGPSATSLLSGFPGCLLTLSAGTGPLVMLMVYAATWALSGSQIEAARLAGGEKTVLFSVSRHVAIPALLAAGLGGVWTLSDPGPGEIFGLRTVAAEILISFSALYDFPLAAQQCAILAGIVLTSALPLAFFAAPRLASEVMVRQMHAPRRVRHRSMGGVAVVVLFVLALINTLAPFLGLILPLAGSEGWLRAWGELVRTAGNTLIYATGAGAIAAVLGLLLAICAGRERQLRGVCISMSLALFSLPPTLAALGVVQLAAAAPAWADPFLRSRITVCAVLGLRFFPIATLLGLRAWGEIAPSWTSAAAVHGVSLTTYVWRVVLPLLGPSGAVALLLTALLATADISTVLLLHPPGARSLPLAIFTVMANAPESLVAALSLVYAGAAVGLLVAGWTIVGKQRV